MLLAWLFASGCTAISNFNHFHFGSDAGTHKQSASDAGVDSGAPSDAGMSCDSTTETDCSDGTDNDCDGLSDCEDPDCKNDGNCCKPNEIPEVSCSGSVDNDCDGLVDCQDPDCLSSTACCVASAPEVGSQACGDGVDNDCDGLVDCQETACAAQSACCNASGDERDAVSCSDGIDNDCDGKKDCADPDCNVVSACCTKSEATETSCDDAVDNDCDGLVDCRDPDCAAQSICANCTPSAPTETNCTDHIDNDCDKDRDCLDPDCAGNLACCVATGPEAGDCVDGIDNDCDGKIDCADSDCSGALDCCVSNGVESGDAACNDGQDNDCDGKIDCADDGCAGSTHCCVPTGTESGTIACNDGIDNDCDGAKDCLDSDCNTGSSCCVPNGSEASQPNDGQDNDCDGLIDIPVVGIAYPPPGLPASGKEVSFTITPSIVSGAVLECESHLRRSAPATPHFASCSNPIKPFDDTASASASNDGDWITNIRWHFASGALSTVTSLEYYIHHTLHNVAKCPTVITDARWFTLARTRLLPSAKLFNPSDKSDTWLNGPFVHVTYEPPNANSIRANFMQDGSAKHVDMWSLRRRFALDSTNQLLLIARNYVSTNMHQCNAAYLRFHNAHYTNKDNSPSYDCEAVVLNREGAGVCMVNSAGNPAFAHDSNDSYANMLGWPKANKFMWRQLLDDRGRNGSGPQTDFSHVESLHYRNFTPKCSASSSCSGNAIFLPDRALFP